MILKPSFLILLLNLFLITAKAQITRQASWQQTVNYNIEVTLDDQKHILRGFETMEYINNSPNALGEIYIHLWPNAYKNNHTAFAVQQLENSKTSFYFAKDYERGYIDSLDFFINGNGTTWAFDTDNQDIAKIILNNPLKPGEKCIISTPFLVKIPKVFSRLGHDGQTYNITQWYPKPAVYDVNGWNPMPYLDQGEFYSEFGSFDVKINLPKNYIVAATGVLISEDENLFRNEKGTNTGIIENTFCKTPIKTVEFRQDSIHDFAWFASKNFGIKAGSIVIGGKTIETFVYSQKKEDLNGKNMEAIKTALTYYSANAGNYPYSHATVVKSELKAGGGMEYPMITVCDFLNREVIIHEVGHNWFYGILANNERRYPWMDESINSYFETEAMKESDVTKVQTKRESFIDKATDFSLDLMAVNASRINTSQAVGLHSADYTDLNYGAMVYGKGALVFKHLRVYLGDEIFKKCFNTYYQTWKYKHPLPGDMQQVFETVSGKKLDWFFQTIINSDTKIDAKIVSVNNKNGVHTVKINQKEMPVPFEFNNSVGDKITGWIENGEMTFSQNVKFKNATILIDPNKVVFDINRKNNSYYSGSIIKRFGYPRIKLLTRPDNSGKREMFILPAIGFNIHNGFLLGVGFHNWSVPLRKFEYMVMPIWGFKTQSLNGYANFNYKITPKKIFQTVDVGINNASFSFVPTSETYTYFRTKGYIHFQVKPKKMRSTTRNYIHIELTNVAARWLEKSSDEADTNRTKPWFINTTSPIDYKFLRLAWLHDNKRVINPYSLKLTAESGGLKNTGIAYWKPGLEFNFFKTYHKKNKGFAIRVFAGSFLSNSKGNSGLFHYRLGSKNGQFDYGMENSLAGRGATTGIWSSHITPGDDNMKLKGTLGNFTKAFVVLNLSSTLPGKIPLKPYLDLCYMQDEFLLNSNNQPQKFVYSGGIAIDIIPKMFTIYFPLVQSKVIDDTQNIQNINSFGQRICFTLVLNDFEPHTLFKKIKIF
ncbi:MAG: M1 family metallopeptidase [Bacteroidia bacterium]